jgi:5'(3')-deoxyribonucleotidase
MIIAIDVDDVLADTSKAITTLFKQKHNLNFADENFYGTESWEAWKKENKEMAINSIQDFLNDENLDMIAPIDGAKEAVKKLKEKNSLVIVTGRPQANISRTREWLDYHFPDTFKEVFSTDWHDLKGEGDVNKGTICHEQGVELIIDDFPQYCLECLSVGTNVLLFDRTWNKNFETPEGITRVFSWDHIIEKINNN